MHQDGIIYRSMVWLTRLAYLNILWIVFSLLGLLAVGFFPATIAMFAVERKWIRGNTSFAILPYFWVVYKNNFKQANVIGFPFVLLFILIYFNLYFTQVMNHFIGNLFFFFLFAILFLVAIVFLYVFPTYIHYDVRMIESIIFSFIIAFSAPLQTFLILVNLFGFFIITLYLPGVFFLFVGSATSLIIMWFAYRAMTQIKNRKELILRHEK
ncbi:YesL family protein [Gracilibacillus kekensis]|uniref:Uncharacterized membrane protein YesL n=1 Tax=Gracilibacillus kekensis TaxID=1027249 RepID=A0A1M7JTM9_9BACI|nr:DUF624 domain-containing protein [Gracilibacillus kekensis]SHM56366.1 Uncharacterized membrane protein YesL [Gracilibacillus kekensis]